MNVQVLVATMHQQDYSLLKKMNIQTDVIVGNQCDKNEIEEFEHQGRTVKWLSLNERGVGLNRNNLLMRATGDIVLFADDDVVYSDGYEQTILRFYQAHPDADVVIFNFKIRRAGTDNEFFDRVTKEGRVNRRSATKYGTYCISAKREKVRFENIFFHLDFGGGARFSNGEDSIFLQDCLKKKLKMYSCKDVIGVIDHGISTWFQGYNDKFFFDKGILFSVLFPGLCVPFALVHCFNKRKRYAEYGWIRAYREMRKGIKFRKREL